MHTLVYTMQVLHACKLYLEVSGSAAHSSPGVPAGFHLSPQGCCPPPQIHPPVHVFQQRASASVWRIGARQHSSAFDQSFFGYCKCTAVWLMAACAGVHARATVHSRHQLLCYTAHRHTRNRSTYSHNKQSDTCLKFARTLSEKNYFTFLMRFLFFFFFFLFL